MKINGYTRITDVLYPFAGYGKIDPDVLQKAADRGTLVHAMIDAYHEKMEFEVQEHVKGYWESFLQWEEGKSHLFKPERFFDEDFMITGEADAIYSNVSGYSLIDYKTSNAESKTWSLQGAAYHFLASSNPNIRPLTKVLFVKLCKSGKMPKVIEYEPYGTKGFNLFLDCLRVYRAFFEDQKMIDVEDL